MADIFTGDNVTVKISNIAIPSVTTCYFVSNSDYAKFSSNNSKETFVSATGATQSTQITTSKITDTSKTNVTVSLSGYCKYNGSQSNVANTSFTLKQAVTKIIINPASTSATLGVGYYNIAYTIEPSNAYYKEVTFNVFSGTAVSINGKPVTVKGDGTSTVTYTSADRKINGSFTITINKASSSMTNPGNKSVTYGSSAAVTISCSNCSVSSASSSNNSAVTVTHSNNTLTLRAVGNAGTSATITVTGTGNAYYNNPGPITFTATVDKAAAVKTDPTAKKGLVYTGSIQVLINAGSSSHGKFYYNSTKSDTGLTEDASSSALGAMSVNTHVRYWKFVSDANHTGAVDWTSISCTIGKANQDAPTNVIGDTTYYPTVATATASGGGGHGPLGWTNGYTLNKVGSIETAAYWSGDSNYKRSPNSNTVKLTVSYYGSYYN